MSDVDYVGNNNPGGESFGQSASSKISFHGAPPVVQASAIANASAPTAFTAPASGAVTVTSAAAGDLTTTANALATLRGEVATLTTKLNSALEALRAKGMIGS